MCILLKVQVWCSEGSLMEVFDVEWRFFSWAIGVARALSQDLLYYLGRVGEINERACKLTGDDLIQSARRL